MTLAHPTSIVLQNLWMTFPFWLSFVVLLGLTGAWIGLLLAFVLSTVASVAYRTLVNKRSVSDHSHRRALTALCTSTHSLTHSLTHC